MISKWAPESGILRTQLRGTITSEDVERWRNELHRELARIPDNSEFKFLLDMHGYAPADSASHKAMRIVIPEILTTHGMRPAFVDLFEKAAEVKLTTERGVRCSAFANVHHDATKMERYERDIAKPDQRFFTDRESAETWLASVSA